MPKANLITLSILLLSLCTQISSLKANNKDTTTYHITYNDFQDLVKKNKILSDSISFLNTEFRSHKIEIKDDAFNYLKNITQIVLWFGSAIITIVVFLIGYEFYRERVLERRIKTMGKKLDSYEEYFESLTAKGGYLNTFQDFYVKESMDKLTGLSLEIVDYLKDKHNFNPNELMIPPDDLKNELAERYALSKIEHPNTDRHKSALNKLSEIGTTLSYNKLWDYIGKSENKDMHSVAKQAIESVMEKISP